MKGTGESATVEPGQREASDTPLVVVLSTDWDMTSPHFLIGQLAHEARMYPYNQGNENT